MTKLPAHNYSLKKVKTFIGHDGYGLNATLYENNKAVAEVVDTASGGLMDIYWKDKGARARFDEYVAGLPDVEAEMVPGELFTYKPDADYVINELHSEFEEDKREKKMKKECQTKTLFTIKSKPDSWFTMKVGYSAAVKESLVEKYGDDLGEIINERYLV